MERGVSIKLCYFCFCIIDIWGIDFVKLNRVVNIGYESSFSVSCSVFTFSCKVGDVGVFIFGFNFVSRMVTILGFVVVIRCGSSVILFLILLILIFRVLKSLSLGAGSLEVDLLTVEEFDGNGGEYSTVVGCALSDRGVWTKEL